MSTANPLDGRALQLVITLNLTPAKGAPVGDTDAAFEIGRKIALEAGLIATRLGGDGCQVRVERQIKAY